MDLSLQLYSARKFQPWEDALTTIADAGYTQVEGFAGVYDDPARLRDTLDRLGLAMPSAHFAVDQLENDYPFAKRIAETLGVSLIVAPYLQPEDRPRDAAGWRDLGRRLEAIGKKAAADGFRFAWHNHDFEFAALPDGGVPQRLILDAAPSLAVELDVAWVVRGGADPIEFIETFGERILAVHVKDIAPVGQATEEDGWADVGHGTIDWTGMMRAIRRHTPARHFIVEHDNPSDLGRFARRSIEAFRVL